MHTTWSWSNHFQFSLWSNWWWCAAGCHGCSRSYSGFLFWNRFLVTAISINYFIKINSKCYNILSTHQFVALKRSCIKKLLKYNYKTSLNILSTQFCFIGLLFSSHSGLGWVPQGEVLWINEAGLSQTRRPSTSSTNNVKAMKRASTRTLTRETRHWLHAFLIYQLLREGLLFLLWLCNAST